MGRVKSTSEREARAWKDGKLKSQQPGFDSANIWRAGANVEVVHNK